MKLPGVMTYCRRRRGRTGGGAECSVGRDHIPGSSPVMVNNVERGRHLDKPSISWKSSCVCLLDTNDV